METTGIIGIVYGLYRDYRVYNGLYRDNGKEMETTIMRLYRVWGYVGIR